MYPSRTWLLVGASGPVSSARSTVKICRVAKAAVSSLCFGPRDYLAAQKENPQSGNTELFKFRCDQVQNSLLWNLWVKLPYDEVSFSASMAISTELNAQARRFKSETVILIVDKLG
ncbi:hypothetical protein K449DRAFT_437586 [Hypoxylon sp. EC38]|nr:hypothetical protein K449DRAFT_437586 [Hypoxylon sp. EC38]